MTCVTRFASRLRMKGAPLEDKAYPAWAQEFDHREALRTSRSEQIACGGVRLGGTDTTTDTEKIAQADGVAQLLCSKEFRGVAQW